MVDVKDVKELLRAMRAESEPLERSVSTKRVLEVIEELCRPGAPEIVYRDLKPGESAAVIDCALAFRGGGR